MPKDALSVQTTTRDGIVATYTAASANGHAVDNSGQKVLIHIKNASGGQRTVTFETDQTVDTDLVLPDRQETIEDGEEKFFGPFPSSPYGNDDDDNDIDPALWISFDSETGVTLAAIKLGAT